MSGQGALVNPPGHLDEASSLEISSVFSSPTAGQSP